MGLLEYRAMPSLRDVAHDGWLCTFTKEQQLEMPSDRSWAAPVRTTGTKKAGGTARPSRTKPHRPGPLLQPTRRAAVLGQPSSLRHHWARRLTFERLRHVM
jgi:hypothetical protein